MVREAARSPAGSLVLASVPMLPVLFAVLFAWYMLPLLPLLPLLQPRMFLQIIPHIE